MGKDRDFDGCLKLLTDTYPGLVSIKMKKAGPNPVLKDKRCKIID